MNESSSDGGQRTLGGDEVDLDRRTCDVYDDEVCGKEAAYEVGDVIACETCAAEITEPEHPDDAQNARKLRATDRLVTDGGTATSDTEQGEQLWSSREEYFEWLDKNINEYECARCGATVSGDPVETRFGPVDLGCYLLWKKHGKIQQRTLADYNGGASA